MAPRRFAIGLCMRLANRRFVFTVAALAVLSAKFVHIYDHLSAVPGFQLKRWGLSFFAQDVAVLIFIRLLLDHWVSGLTSKPRFLVNILTAVAILYNISIGMVSVSFYLAAGAEIHWRNAALATDSSSWGLLLSGFMSFILVFCLIVLFSWLLQDVYYGFFGYAADIVNWPFAFVYRSMRRVALPQYSQIPQLDVEYAVKDDGPLEDDIYAKTLNTVCQLLQPLFDKVRIHLTSSKISFALNIVAYVLTTVALLALLSLAIARPNDGSLIFLSWATALIPFVDFSSSSPTLQELPSHYGTGIQYSWDNRSALAEPPSFNWLPEALNGFDDWYTGEKHYNADSDPMKISNLDGLLLPTLEDKLRDIPIQHVMLFFLESTRNDIFPIKKDGLIWNRLAETWPNNELPLEVQEKMANLTPTANYITGDYNDGFDHDEASKKKRGGVRFTNAHTTGTYTLKSLVGTLCGVAPLIADFNLDIKHHLYQPCLPHIFDALNKLDVPEEVSHPYGNAKWHSYHYQAATTHYDKQDLLMSQIGFLEANTIDREYLKSPTAKHGAVDLPMINTFAFEEDPLEEYIRDVFIDAKDKNERVFLSHLTSTSHHAFKMPKHEPYLPMANGIDMFSHYVNSEGYDDKWIRKVLNVLDEQGVANETLIVFVGDHGLSMPENDIVSPYYNPSIGIDHVPLILSHPMLPAFDVDDAVHSSQILPTILDILLETDSLNNASRQAATDLVRNYEGQSLIRPLRKFSTETGQGNWQFTLVNPGRAVLTARDARYPERHLVIPVIDNVEWRLSNITADPREQNAVQGFDFLSFLRRVKREFGDEVAAWVEEGAFMSRWWVEENSKRWRYGPYAR